MPIYLLHLAKGVVDMKCLAASLGDALVAVCRNINSFKYAVYLTFVFALNAQAISLDVSVDSDVKRKSGYTYYKLLIANNDGVTRTGVKVKMTVPTGLRFNENAASVAVNCTSSTCDAGEAPVWDIGTLEDGESFSILIPIYYSDAYADGDVAQIESGIIHDDINDYLYTNTAINFDADVPVELSVAASSMVVEPNAEVEYEVSLGHVGTTGMVSTGIEFDIPAGMQFVSATEGGSSDGSVVTWDTGVINAGTSLRRLVILRVPSDAEEGQIFKTNTRFIYESEIINTAYESVVVKSSPDLTLDVTTTGDSKFSSYVYYKYLVSNTGNLTKTDVTLKVLTSVGSAFYENYSYPSVSCSSSTCNADEWATYSLGQLEPGESKVVLISAYSSSAEDGMPWIVHTLLTDASGTHVQGAKPTVLFESDKSGVLSITADKQAVDSDGEYQYEVSFANIGTSALQGAEIEVELPEGIIIGEISDGGSYENGILSWTLGTVNAGESGKRFVDVSLDDGLEFGDTLIARALLTDNDDLAIKAGESVVVKEPSGLTFDVTYTSDHKFYGEYAYYKYIVSNSGELAATDVNLRVMMGVGSAFTEAYSFPSVNCSSSSCNADEWAVFSLGELEPGESKIIIIPAFTSTGVDGLPWINHAVLTDASNNFVQGTKPTVLFHDDSDDSFGLSIAANNQALASGDEFTYEISFGNISSSAARQTELELDLPPEVAFVSASEGGDYEDGTVTWDIGTLSVGDNSKRFVTVKVADDLGDGLVLIAKALLTSEDESLVRASESVVIKSDVDLTLDVTYSSDLKTPGEYTHYRYVISNQGAIARTDVSLRVMSSVDSAFYESNAYPSVNCSSSTCNSDEWAVYSIGELEPGQSKVFQVPVYNSDSTDGATWITHAILTEGSGDYVQSIKPTVLYESEESLRLTLTANQQVVEAGDVIQYEVTYGNTSDSAFQNAVASLDLPDGVSVLDISDSGTLVDGQIEWPIGTISAGDVGKRFVSLLTSDELPDGYVMVGQAEMFVDDESLVRAGDSVVVHSDIGLDFDVALTTAGMWPQGLGRDQLYSRYIISNKGDVSRTDVTLNIMVSEFSRYAEDSSRPTANCSSSTCDAAEWATYELGEIEPGESRVVTIPQYSSSKKDGAYWTNHAILTDGNDDYVQGFKTNIDWGKSSENEAQLNIAAQDMIVVADQNVTFDLMAGNSTGDTVENAIVRVDIPENYSFVSATGLHEVRNQSVFWPLGNFANETIANLSVVLKASSELIDGELLKVKASLLGDESRELIAESSEVTLFNSEPSLALSIAADYEPPLTTGSEVALTISTLNEDAFEIADVSLYLMPPVDSYIQIEDTGINGCSIYCYAFSWGHWISEELGGGQSEIHSANMIFNSFNPGAVTPLMAYLTHSSSPLNSYTKLYLLGIGTVHTVEADFDSDGDGIPDYWEIAYSNSADWLDGTDADLDYDNDGYTNLEEYLNGLSPEVRNERDSDLDGLQDSVEIALGLNPDEADTDGDGMDDNVDNYPNTYNETLVGLVDVIEISDIDGDGTQDYAVVLIDDEQNISAEIRSGAEFDSTLKTIQWSTPYQSPQVVVVPDLNDNGVDEIGVFGMRLVEGTDGAQQLKPQFEVRDPADNSLNKYNWPANWLEASIVMLDDLTGDGISDFGLQGRFINEGARPQLIVKDAMTGNTVKTYGYPNLFNSPVWAQHSDFDGDGIGDITLAGELIKNGKTQIKLTSGADDGDKLVAYNFADNWSNVSWHKLFDIDGDGINDWGMFGTRKDDGRPQLFTKRGNSQQGTLGIFAWPGDFLESKLLVVPDMNFDGVADVAVAAYKAGDSKHQMIIKSGVDRNSTVFKYSWPDRYTDLTYMVLADLTDDGLAELALLGVDDGDNEYTLFVKHGDSSLGNYSQIKVGSDWMARPQVIVLPDQDGDGVADLLFYGNNNAAEPLMQVVSGQ